MLRKLFGSANFYLVTTVNIVIATGILKDRINKLAETDTVHSPFEYVAVRAARGDYNNINGFETMKFDYKFYDIISNPKNGQPRK